MGGQTETYIKGVGFKHGPVEIVVETCADFSDQLTGTHPHPLPVEGTL